ncbi:zf-HC2 domain-containing protein [Streptomyces sp. NPDC054940]
MTVPPDDDAHVELLLGAYVLGALSAVEDRRVAAHLAECDRCGAAYLGVADVPDFLALFSETDLAEGLGTGLPGPDGDLPGPGGRTG